MDLDATLHEVLGDLEEAIHSKAAVIKADVLPQIRGSAVLMRQLFQNLISNALKYASTERAPHIEIRCDVAEGQHHIRFIDNGIGFDQSHATRIFEVFQRLHGKTEYEGTGIGLATCRRIVALHGGSICADSKPDKGTTFTVSLPAEQAKLDTD